ncbi:unnamed protein product, partial [Coregonus sp. 'balchen']
MDLHLLSRIDEELDSSEVAALCFLCRDVLNRKRLETVQDGRDLFLRLQEKSLLEDHYFLSQLLNVIGRLDLLRLLETDSRQPEQTAHTQTDACPALSQYRRMLYKVSEDVTQENLTKIKFLLSNKLPRGRLDLCTTALEVLCEMERQGLLTEDRLDELQMTLEECDTQLAHTVRQHRGARGSLSRQEYTMERYSMTHKPRGTCLIINNHHFIRFSDLTDRTGTEQDESRHPRSLVDIMSLISFKALNTVFSNLGFRVEVGSDMTKKTMLEAVQELGMRSHLQADALVVCVLSHGEKGCVFGTDGEEVPIRSLTQPFTSEQCPSLVGKPKLFFIQACQGKGFQRGSPLPPPSRRQGQYEADATESVPCYADFLIGMATVEECKSFRNTKDGSIYIQELCKQLDWGADSRGVFKDSKQMPEPKYTLTKKLFLSYL